MSFSSKCHIDIVIDNLIPYRVIFLECDMNICRERVVLRRVNVHTGSTYNLLHTMSPVRKTLGVHPKDKDAIIQAEVNTRACDILNI